MTDLSTRPAKNSDERGEFVLRDRPAIVWLFLALIAVVFHNQLPGGRWLMVHLVVLGAVTHSITVWSNYFAVALLKPSPSIAEPRSMQAKRLGLLNAGIVVVIVGVPMAWWVVAAVGGALIVVELCWHAWVLLRMARHALPAPFAIAVYYYLAATAFFPVGITLGALLARGFGDPTFERVLVAHTMINLLGWVGLSIIGTLLTLWPTVLRARIDSKAARRARLALIPLILAVAAVALSALFGSRPGAAAGLIVYLLGVVLAWRSMLGAVKRTPPRTFAVGSVAAGQLWLAAGLVTLTITVLRHDWVWIGNHYGVITMMFVVGFVLQTLLGAMNHLIPTVVGRGPRGYKAAVKQLDLWGPARVTLLNGALVVALLPVPDLVRWIVAALGLASLASYIPLLFKAIHAALAARADVERNGPGTPAPPVDDRTRPIATQVLTAITALALAVAVGSAVTATTAGTAAGAADAARVIPTGQTTTVAVDAHDMRFTPSTITVPKGNRLVINLTNTDKSQVHDLVLANGVFSPRLSPGQHARLDAGVIGASLDGWCSVIGHRQMGMTMRILVSGAGSAAGTSSPAGSTSSASPLAGTTPYNPMALPGKGFQPWDASLPPVPTGTTHRVTFTMEDSVHEVAPGVTQTRWTYNGGLASPVLHGHIGDTFVVTLINKSSMGHSIDFHAGALAPDQPMRTIAPGQSLVYTFKATRAGIWMYHCATMPMSAHIAAGMAGAVIIDPPGLPPVAESVVLVQSEIYTSPGGMVDPAKVATEQPDLVVFNGYAGQYDHAPLHAKVGQRVRIWVLDAGPNRSTTFHVIGSQFDTVYKEGAYLLKDGRDAFGDTGGGSQALDLGPAQGGFVELTFPQAGHYPFVSHHMSDAEKGAHGIFDVTN